MPSDAGTRGDGRCCKNCGTHIPESRAPNAVHCSAECRIAHKNAKISEQRRNARAGRICVRCGDPVPDSRQKSAKTCSPECQYEFVKEERKRRNAAALAELVCKYSGCGKPLAKAKRRTRMYCNERCFRLAKEERDPGSGSRKARRSNLMRWYGITEEAYDEMLAIQGGLCSICRRPPGKRLLAVDHYELPGGEKVVRALLCERCNTGLGDFRHDPPIIQGAIAYLENWRGR